MDTMELVPVKNLDSLQVSKCWYATIGSPAAVVVVVFAIDNARCSKSRTRLGPTLPVNTGVGNIFSSFENPVASEFRSNDEEFDRWALRVGSFLVSNQRNVVNCQTNICVKM